MKKSLPVLFDVIAILAAALSSLYHLKSRAPAGYFLWLPKLLAGALTPFLALAGAISAAAGLAFKRPLSVQAGGYAAINSASHFGKITRSHDQFTRAFGRGWEHLIPPTYSQYMLMKRWSPRLPAVPSPIVRRDVPYWTLPNGERQLLCDLWLPSPDVPHSGLGFIYAHGSAWYLGDKDTGTRTFFKHLAAQGHVVMDIAYRLSPETDMFGMLADVKRAIAWMKTDGGSLGVNPLTIVVGGASAGGHLALLAAYAPDHPQLTPVELEGRDLSVRGVVSEYGPVDLVGTYYHTRQQRLTPEAVRQALEDRQPSPASIALHKVAGRAYDRFGLGKPSVTGSLMLLLDGTPEDVPEMYALFSPIEHVHRGCPPTLLIQGEDDVISPYPAARAMFFRLVADEVPVVNLVLPGTDHAFDLVLPQISPPAQAALYDLERFLALMAILPKR